MILRAYKTEAALTGITIGIILMMVLFNDINIHIRIREIKLFLQSSNRVDNSIDHIGLIMKYRLHKKMYENKITLEESNIIEMRVNSILSEETYNKKIIQEKYQYLSIPVLHTINFFRYLTGMESIRDIERDDSDVNLEIAYYYERNKKYRKAIQTYDSILKKGDISRPYRASILLHQGFCYSILGNYNMAREKFMGIIKKHGDVSVAVTAAVLLRYIEGFKSEIDKVLKSDPDSIVKGEKLYKLIAYRESYEVIKKIEKSIAPKDISRIKFFKGRCLEEMAEKEKALNLYQEIILKDTKSEYARSANRRIYLTAAAEPDGERIKTLAMKNNLILKDKTLKKMIQEETRIVRTSSHEMKIKKKKIFIKTLKKHEKGQPKSVREMKSLDTMIRSIDKKIKLRNIKLDRAVIPERVKIYTTDGNIFTGTITRESKEFLILKTSIGSIKIDKNKISRQIKF